MKRPQTSSSKRDSANPRPEPLEGIGLHKHLQDLRDRILKSYVNDDVLDVSEASDFYKREAAVTEALADYVERLSDAHYKLKNGLDTWFRKSFPIFLAPYPSQPADALAHSLFRMAQAWANSKYADSLAGDWRCTRFEALTNEWKKSWNRMDENDWKAFREMSSPLATYITTALDEKGNVDHALCYVPTADHIEVGVSFEQDLQQSPEMRILVKGGPAVSFMTAYIRKSQGKGWPKDRKDELEYLRVIFESAVSTVAKEFLGLTKPNKGRPRDVGELAAYRLYHERKPVRLVSRELCSLRQEPNHLCDSKCSDKMKKAAANHFKYLRQEILSLMMSSKKESV